MAENDKDLLSKFGYTSVNCFPKLPSNILKVERNGLYGVFDASTEEELHPCTASEISVVGNNMLRLKIPTKLFGFILWIPKLRYLKF